MKLKQGGIFNSLYQPLTKSQLQSLDMDDMTYLNPVTNDYDEPIGYIYEKDGKLGAYNLSGRNYAPFIYDDVRGVHDADSPYYGDIGYTATTNIYEFKRHGESLYDIYDCDYLVSDCCTAPCYLLKDFVSSCSYIILQCNDEFCVYERSSHSTLACISLIGKITAVNFKRNEIISYNEVNDCSYIYGYDGKVKVAFPNCQEIKFTNTENYIVKCYNKYGLYVLQNDKWEEVIPVKYNEILQVLPNKAVVKTVRGLIKFISFFRKMNKKTGQEEWGNKILKYKYRISTAITSAFLLQDEDEAILTFTNGKKILLSHYLLPDHKPYECDEILHEHDGIFKCFHYNDAIQTEEITYICHEQAIPEIQSSDNTIHVNKLHNYYKIFTPEGKVLFDKTPVSYVKPISSVNGALYNDFMTVPKQNHQNLFQIANLKGNVQILNGVTGKFFDTTTNFHMVWHNLFLCDHSYEYVEELSKDDYDALHSWKFQFCAAFDDFIVIKYNTVPHIISSSTACRMDIVVDNGLVNVDRTARNCVCYNDDKAYFVSDFIIEYDFAEIIDGLRVYRNGYSNNFIIGDHFVQSHILKEELAQGIISPSFAKLVK